MTIAQGQDLHATSLRRSFDKTFKESCLQQGDKKGQTSSIRVEPTESRQSPSSQSSYSDENDITALIRELSWPDPKRKDSLGDSTDSGPPSTIPSSSSSFNLGKRKLSDLSDSSDQRPIKVFKSTENSPDPFPEPCNETSPHSITPGVEIIAHSPLHQSYFDKLELGFGVQFEIARLSSCGLFEYKDIRLPKLEYLKGPNADAAPQTVQVLGFDDRNHDHDEAYNLAFAKEVAAKSPWEELDTEERLLRANPLAGLGFGEECPDWYGGKVHFRAKLVCNRSDYKVTLERAELGPSCRFARRFGSTSFLRVKVPLNVIHKSNNMLVEFFSRPFLLNGRVYRSFYAKDENVFLFKTNEVVRGYEISAGPVDSPGLSLMMFLNWHNSLVVNKKQTLTKWASRFSLGLSTSVPALRFKPTNILHEDDIISPTESDMTDGAGFINKLALLQMQTRFGWDTFPTAIQCRLAGSKGLLHVQPNVHDDAQEHPVARLRPSQVKIKYPDGEPDPATLTLDLLCSSHMRVPSRLSHEILINLAENKVHHTVFVKLFQEGLSDNIDPYMKWDDTVQLWRTVAHRGGVLASRRAREAGGESRAKGYGERENDDIEFEDEDGLRAANALRQKSTAWWWDELSGCPSSIEETVMVLLDAGFTPTTCSVLREKLRKSLNTQLDTYAKKCRVDVPMSCTAFIIPDPFQVLGPREVHIKSSLRKFKTENGLETDIVRGDVLLARHPCKLPTDVQKFQAVEKAELRHLTDVIVCSTQGDRRQADLLAGGDYDGDKVLAIWQPDIVNHFVNADLSHADEPEGLAACFDYEKGTVAEFLEKMGTEPVEAQIEELQKVLLGTIRDRSIVGTYSKFHENAIYKYGYGEKPTTDLAYKFCKVLDGAKTGLTINARVLRKDRSDWERTLPPRWKELTEDKQSMFTSMDNKANLQRPSDLPKFIMDKITKCAKEARDRRLGEVGEVFDSWKKIVVDADLTEPWLEAVKLADRFVEEEGNDRMKRDLEKIAEHVHTVYQSHRKEMAQLRSSPRKDRKNTAGGAATVAQFTDLPIEVRQDNLRALSNEFRAKPRMEEVMMDEAEVRRLRASYAYYYDSSRRPGKWTRFPWDVGMRELGAIKAQAIGQYKTVTANFYRRFFIK